MKTTEEILENVGIFTSNVSRLNTYTKENVKLAMIEYAKEVLQPAAKKAECNIKTNDWQDRFVNKDSILNLINKLK
jgi:hypothetical protein